MIPKIIHYCWFGQQKIPFVFQQYIDGWDKILPDYQKKMWSEKNFDLQLAPEYVRQAYANKKFAFVADYVRLWALYNEGGIYLDTDIELKKDLTPYLDNGFFSSVEYHKDMVKALNVLKHDLTSDFNRKPSVEHIRGIGIQSAMFGSEKGHPFLKECLLFYKDRKFILADGVLNDKVILPDILALCAEKFGFRYIEGEQILRERLHIYPQDIFTGIKNVTERTVAIHRAHNSWRNKSIGQRMSMYLSQSILGRNMKRILEILGIRNELRKWIWFKNA